MKKRLLILIAPLLAGLSLFADSSSLVLHGEYDLNTNAPNISIQHTNGQVAYLGSGWVKPMTVNYGDIWTVSYPATDCQSNADWGASAPVILNGTYTAVTSGVTNKFDIWIRLTVGYSGAAFVFYQDPTTPWSLTAQCIQATQCAAPAPPAGGGGGQARNFYAPPKPFKLLAAADARKKMGFSIKDSPMQFLASKH